jgi:hypothetical protein
VLQAHRHQKRPLAHQPVHVLTPPRSRAFAK